jgi:O-antigen/teichoic acid export membrane protein
MTTVLENAALARKANRLYPFLKEKLADPLNEDDKRVIVKNTKALIGHKVGSVAVRGTDNILISIFVGVVEVGLYSNYILLINGVKTVYRLIFQSLSASIGNMGVTEDQHKSKFVFFSLDLFGFWFFYFSSICLFILFKPVITKWLGAGYVFDTYIEFFIVISFFLTGRRGVVLTFRDALGLFWYDRYKPFFEAGINLIASIILARHFGFIGVVWGTILSTILVCFWVEPYVLFKYGFHSSAKEYFIRYSGQIIILVLGGGLTWFMAGFSPEHGLLAFILKALICLVVPNVLFLAVYGRSEEFRYLLSKVPRPS